MDEQDEFKIRDALRRVQIAKRDCVELLSQASSIQRFLSAWVAFVDAALVQAESVLSSGDEHVKSELPPFNSQKFSMFIGENKPVSREVTIQVIDRLRAVAGPLNDACEVAKNGRPAPVLMAIGYVFASVVELEMCMVAAYPDLDIFGDEDDEE